MFRSLEMTKGKKITEREEKIWVEMESEMDRGKTKIERERERKKGKGGDTSKIWYKGDGARHGKQEKRSEKRSNLGKTQRGWRKEDKIHA